MLGRLEAIFRVVGWLAIAVIGWAIFVGPVNRWLVLTAWFLAIGKFCFWFYRRPGDHPMKQAAYVAAVLGVICDAFWGRTMKAGMNLMFNPSEFWLKEFLFSKSSLGIAIIYLSFACLFYSRGSEKDY